MHFMNPVPLMKLVEIIRGIATDVPTYETAVNFAQSLGKITSNAEDFPAFIVNRLFVPMALDALRMRERTLGPTHPSVGESLGLLATICMRQGRTPEAVAYADRSIELLGDATTGRGPAWSSMIAIKARAALDDQDAARAEPLVAQALRARLRGMSPDDPALLESLAQAGELCALSPGALGGGVEQVWGQDAASAADAVAADILILRGAAVMPAPRRARTGRTAAISRVLRLQAALLGADDPAAVGMLMAQFQ